MHIICVQTYCESYFMLDNCYLFEGENSPVSYFPSLQFLEYLADSLRTFMLEDLDRRLDAVACCKVEHVVVFGPRGNEAALDVEDIPEDPVGSV